MIRSLRWRMLIGSSIATSAILGALGVALYASMRSALTSEFDSASLAQAHALAGMTELKHGGLRFDSEQPLPQFAQKENPEYFEIRLDDGRFVARSASLGVGHLSLSGPLNQTVYQSITLPDGKPGRGIALRFTPHGEQDEEAEDGASGRPPQSAVVLFARETRELNETLRYLRSLLATLFGLAIVVSGAVLFAVVAGAMRPVRRLAAEIEAFPETELSRRLSSRHVPVELASVVDRLNGLLARLEDAFVRERSFSADVAHELRTPIAGLHTTLEVCRSRPRDVAAYEATIDRCLKISDGIRSMVRTLLLLARADSGQLGTESSTVDIAALTKDCWMPFAKRAADRGVRVESDLEVVVIDADLEKLKMILNNLIDNAISYVDDCGTIQFQAQRAGDELLLRVANTGSSITPAQLPHLTERFWRGDESRSDTGLHCGLGLSLCNRLAILIGGRLRIDSKDGLFTATLTLAVSNGCDQNSGRSVLSPSRGAPGEGWGGGRA